PGIQRFGREAVTLKSHILPRSPAKLLIARLNRLLRLLIAQVARQHALLSLYPCCENSAALPKSLKQRSISFSRYCASIHEPSITWTTLRLNCTLKFQNSALVCKC